MSKGERGPRLLLVITELTGGGAERVMSTMASYWAERGRDVTLITLWSVAKDFYPLSPRVRRIALGLESESASLWQSLWMTLRRVRALRREVRATNPDVVISFMDVTNMLTLVATRGLSLPLIVSERVDASHHAIGRLRSQLRRRLYPWSDAIVVQSGDIARWARTIVTAEAVRIIPNPVRPMTLGRAAEPRPVEGEHVIVSMGRLSPEKQVHFVLRAFAGVAQDNPDWYLAVLGEGPDRQSLQGLANELRIATRVRWMGLVAEPEQVLQHADLLVLTSRYEGFPNALLEGMACGLPVVSFDCPSGPRHIVRDGIDGLLVPAQDLDALAAAMRRLMSDPSERKRLGARAVEVSERFGLDRVMAMWDDLIDDVIAQARGGNRT